MPLKSPHSIFALFLCYKTHIILFMRQRMSLSLSQFGGVFLKFGSPVWKLLLFKFNPVNYQESRVGLRCIDYLCCFMVNVFKCFLLAGPEQTHTVTVLLTSPLLSASGTRSLMFCVLCWDQVSISPIVSTLQAWSQIVKRPGEPCRWHH